MSSILTEDTIKSSYGLDGLSKNENNDITFSSTDVKEIVAKALEEYKESEVKPLIKEELDQYYESKVKPLIQICAKDINSLKEENAGLRETIKELRSNKSSETNENIENNNTTKKSPNASRAEMIIPILRKEHKLGSGDIIRICKLGSDGHRTAQRVMNWVVKLYPDECKKDEGITGAGKIWLIHKDYWGF